MMRENEFAEPVSALDKVRSNRVLGALRIAAVGLALTACVPEHDSIASAQPSVDQNNDGVVDLSGVPVDEMLPVVSASSTVEALEESADNYSEYMEGPERAAILKEALNEQTLQLLEAIDENPHLYVFTRRDNGEEGSSSFIRVEGADSLGRSVVLNIFGKADETSPIRVPLTTFEEQDSASETETFGFTPTATSAYVFPLDTNGDTVSSEPIMHAAISRSSEDLTVFVTSISDSLSGKKQGYIARLDGVVKYTGDVESSPEANPTEAEMIDGMAASRVLDIFAAAEEMTSSRLLPASK